MMIPAGTAQQEQQYHGGYSLHEMREKANTTGAPLPGATLRGDTLLHVGPCLPAINLLHGSQFAAHKGGIAQPLLNILITSILRHQRVELPQLVRSQCACPQLGQKPRLVFKVFYLLIHHHLSLYNSNTTNFRFFVTFSQLFYIHARKVE